MNEDLRQAKYDCRRMEDITRGELWGRGRLIERHGRDRSETGQ
jgi:hypothetical protein